MLRWLLRSVACTIGGIACSGGTRPSDGAAGSSGSTAKGGAANAQGGLSAGGSSARGGASAGGEVGSGGASSGGAMANAGANARGGSTASTSSGGVGSGGVATGGAAVGGKSSGGASAGGRSSTGGGGGRASGGSGGSAGSIAGSGGSTAIGCGSAEAGYKLVWNDEFEGAEGSAVDATKWMHDVGGTGWGNNELEYYTDGAANAALDGNGNLIITAKKQSMGGKMYTSARLKTQGLYTFTYGRVESRMKIPSGPGLWPAFWTLGSDISTNAWPNCGEIDIMENIGKEPNIIHATIHGPGYYGSNGPTKQYSLPEPIASTFHVFAIEWEQNIIRWYVDGTLYSTKTNADIPSNATWVYSHPFFILLNVAVGGTFAGDPDSTTTFPQTMTIDYVRVCQK